MSKECCLKLEALAEIVSRESSNLWNYDEQARRRVLTLGMPKALVDKVGLDNLIQRLPESYSRSIFSSYVASRFIYTYSVNASSIDFLQFFTSLNKASLS